MTKKVLSLLLVLTMMVPVLLTGCSNEAGGKTNTPTIKQELILSMAEEPQTFDIHAAYSANCTNVTYGVFEPLIRVEADGVHPSGAESWTISEDGLTWTFKIRQGMKWSDGVALTAQHYEDAFHRQFDPNTLTSYGSLATYFKGGTAFFNGEDSDWEKVGVKALDDYTLECTLETPVGYFLQLISMQGFNPIRLDQVEKFGDAYAGDVDKMSYCGPFVMTAWEHDVRVVLEKNKDYWNAKNVNLEKVTFEIVSDAATRASMFDKGEVDFTTLAQAQLEQYKDNSALKTFETGSVTFMHVQHTHKVLGNKNFRLALGWALDRQSFCENSLSGASKPALRFVPSSIMGAAKPFTEETPDSFNFSPTGDVAKAKEYLDAALKELGYKSVDELPVINILTNDRENNRLAIEYVQASFEQNLGIKTEINIKPQAQRRVDENSGNYELNISGWGPDYADPMGYLYAFKDGFNYRHCNWDSTEFTKLLDAATIETDAAKRMDLMGQAEKLLMEDVGFIPIFFGIENYLLNDKVEGITRNAVGMDTNYIYAKIVK